MTTAAALPCRAVTVHSVVESATIARCTTVMANTKGNATEAITRLRFFQPLGSNAWAIRLIVSSASRLTGRRVPAGTVST